MERNIVVKDLALAFAFALVVGGLLLLIHVSGWLWIGSGVLIAAGVIQAGKQVPSNRIIGRDVRVLWGFDDPKPGKVLKWVNMSRGRTAEVLLDGMDKSILVPLTSLEFPWYERLRHFLPARINWRSAPEQPSPGDWDDSL